MIYLKKPLNLVVLFLSCCLLYSATLSAATQVEIEQLEADMLNYFSTRERSAFIRTTNKLKEACKESGDEKLYYKAWGYMSVYEAMQQNYSQALDIAQDIMIDARENGSVYGEYTALHTEAMVLLQRQDYEIAEKAFLEAVDFHRRHFSNESAGEDLMELMTIAIHRRDAKSTETYARLIVNEPNVDPKHRGKALYYLSQLAFDRNDTTEFNRIFRALMLLKETDVVSGKVPLLEVNHAIINGDYTTALRLSDSLDIEKSAERKAHIYHLMGNDTSAYTYMLRYKTVSDSLMLETHENAIAEYYEQLNRDRMLLEQQKLERENNRLRNWLYFSAWALIFVVLVYSVWKSRKLIKMLRSDNMQLVYEKKDAERALTDLNELSYFESKTDLPLTLPFMPNVVCDRLATVTQAHCYKGVTMLFQTDLTDDFEFHTNADALKQLLVHLLNYAARFTHKGIVKLSCMDAGENIRFVVTDTSAGLGSDAAGHVVGMFSEQNNKIRYVGMNFNICQSITRLLHGRIWHDTEYTDGTRFCFELPKEPVAQAV